MILEELLDAMIIIIRFVPNTELKKFIDIIRLDEDPRDLEYYHCVCKFFVFNNYKMDNYTKSLLLPLLYAKLNINP